MLDAPVGLLAKGLHVVDLTEYVFGTVFPEVVLVTVLVWDDLGVLPARDVFAEILGGGVHLGALLSEDVLVVVFLS